MALHWSIWAKLAKSDLDSARVLYSVEHYRTSYFLFQQAVEKANKALFILLRVAFNEEMRGIGHDQFKLIRRDIEIREEKLKALIESYSLLDKNNGMQIITNYNERLHMFAEVKRAIDGLKHEDLINIPEDLLNTILDQLNKLKVAKQELQQVYKVAIALATNEDSPIKKFKSPSGLKLKEQFEKFARLLEEDDTKKIMNWIKEINELTKDYLFIYSTIYFLAILTIQHSSRTRYPTIDFNPIETYNLTLPIVKRQTEFMGILELAIENLKGLEKLEELSNNNPFKIVD